jgi:hypothetical protein
MSKNEYLSREEAAKILDCSDAMLDVHINYGNVGIRYTEDRTVEILREDVERQAERNSAARADVQRAFDNREENMRALVVRASGVDPEVARSLGY